MGRRKKRHADKLLTFRTTDKLGTTLFGRKKRKKVSLMGLAESETSKKVIRASKKVIRARKKVIRASKKGYKKALIYGKVKLPNAMIRARKKIRNKSIYR